MPPALELEGQTFGRLKVLERRGSNECNKAQWLCRCDCGNATIVTSGNLNSGNTKSCGCLKPDRTSEMHRLDLEGKKFGRLTAIERVGKNDHGQYNWRFECECGNKVVTNGSSVKTGHTRSCGCLHHDIVSEKKVDLEGEVFGRLKVLERGEKDEGGQYHWECVCECGEHVSVRHSSLIDGKTKSCGCLWRKRMAETHRLDLKHQKFGYLKPLEILKADKHNNCIWLCKCDCGKMVEVIASNLTTGNTESCGCRKRDMISRNSRTHGMTGTIEYRMWTDAKKRAKNNGLDFDISPLDIDIPEKCPVLGIQLETGDGAAKPSSPSIDRLDSQRGYTKDNIEVISFRANTIKSDASFEEIERIYKWMTNRVEG